MARERYEEVVLALGDLARERLANDPAAPAEMQNVFAAEDVVVDLRDAVKNLENDINTLDAEHHDAEAARGDERAQLQTITQKFRKVVEAVEGRSREIRKKILGERANLKLDRASTATFEKKHRDLELTRGHDQEAIARSLASLKKARLHLMRRQRYLEELEQDLESVLTVRPGAPGARAIEAHRRILELEDESENAKSDFDTRMAELDAVLAAREQELEDAEQQLDEAVFLLGEAVYAARHPDPQLAALYSRIDKVAPKVKPSK